MPRVWFGVVCASVYEFWFLFSRLGRRACLVLMYDCGGLGAVGAGNTNAHTHIHLLDPWRQATHIHLLDPASAR